MPAVIIEKVYRFTPPHEGRFWTAVLQPLLPWYLNRFYGVETVECRGVERLHASLEAGNGVLLAPNHCRPPDPFVLGALIPEIHRPLFMMASAHLFLGGGAIAWVLPRI